jgi:predicted dehydrogenase
VLAPRKDLLRLRKVDAEEGELQLPAPPPSGPLRDQLAYLVSVVRGETKPSGPSSLEINLIVTEILDAARESAHTGRRVDLPPVPAQ